MADQVTKNVNILVSLVGADKAADGLGKLGDRAQRVQDKLNSLANWTLGLGGLAGALAIGETLRGLDEVHEAVARVARGFGEVPQEVHALTRFMGGFGVDVQDATDVMVQFRKEVQSAFADPKGGADRRKLFKAMGINAESTSREIMLGISKGVTDGKLALDRAFQDLGMGDQEQRALARALRLGPEQIKKQLEALEKSSSAITEQRLRAWERLERARVKMKQGWQDLIGILYTTFVPVIARFAEGLSKAFQDAQPKMEAFATFLVDHMESIVALAKTFFMIMTANKLLDMMGMGGLLGFTKRLHAAGTAARAGDVGLARRSRIGFHQDRALLDRFGDKAVLRPRRGPLAASARRGGMMLIPARMIASIRGLFAGIMKGLRAIGPFLGPVIRALMGLSVWVLAIFLVIKGVIMAWKSDLWGLRTSITNTWKRIRAIMAVIAEALGPALQLSWDFLKYIGGAFLWIMDKVMKMVEGILFLVLAIGLYLKRQFSTEGLTSAPWTIFGRAMRDAAERVQGMLKKDKGATGGEADVRDRSRPAKNVTYINQVNVENKFEEGFDPSLVATVFANDLADLAEGHIAYAPGYSG